MSVIENIIERASRSEHAKFKEVWELILKYRPNMDMRNENGQPMIMHFTINGDLNAVTLLVKYFPITIACQYWYVGFNI